MKRFIPIIALAAAALMLSGCDFFRSLVGRPTSNDLELKKVLIENEAKTHKGDLDSLKNIQKQISDSLEVLDSIKKANNVSVLTRPLAEESRASLSCRYYVIIGSFLERSNAEGLQKLVETKGYQSTLINYNNGYTALGVSPSNNLIESIEVLKKLKTESFCPEDAWILEND